ncbi:phosphatidylglycerophosphatase A family protein [Facklamia languida]
MKKSKAVVEENRLMQEAYRLLEERGVKISDIADIVLDLQGAYVSDLTKETCIENVHAVMQKREVQNAIVTGIELDKLAEEGKLSPILTDILMRDEGLYGIDEILILSIVNVYGSIGLTNFGYVDKLKPGIIGELNDQKGKLCNTFIDDIVGALAAAAASRIAHAQHEVNL